MSLITEIIEQMFSRSYQKNIALYKDIKFKLTHMVKHNLHFILIIVKLK